MTDSNLADSIMRLDAERAIRHLLASYVHYNDEGKFAEVAELLQYAEFDVAGNVVSGRAEIEAFLEAGVQRHADGVPRTWHTVTNVLIDVDSSGKRASSSSYYTVHQQLEDFPLQPIVTGKYLDQFERHDGQWHFTHRAVTVHLLGNLQHHVKGANEHVMGPSA